MGAAPPARYARTRPSSSSELPIDTFIGLAAVIILVAANAFFVAGEFALVAIDPSRVEALSDRRPRRARIVQSLLGRLSFHLSGAQLGITISSLILGFIAQDALSGILDAIPGVDASGATAGVVALSIATVFQMVFGELVPKNLAIAKPDTVAFALSPIQNLYGIVAKPLIGGFDGAANAVVRRLGMEPVETITTGRSLDELEQVIVSSSEAGSMTGEERDLLIRSIRFGELDAADALVPRPDMVVLRLDDTVADLRRQSLATGHSRFPVIGDDLDDVKGIVDVTDVFTLTAEQREDTPVAAILRDVVVVPESRELNELLDDMRASRTRLALVVDEHGGTAGIVTIEDLLEELVGDIADEYDVPVALTATVRAGAYEVDGSLRTDEVTEAVGVEVPEGPYETVAGFVLDRLGRIPTEGDFIDENGWRFTVVAMDRRRVSRVSIRSVPTDSGEEDDQ